MLTTLPKNCFIVLTSLWHPNNVVLTSCFFMNVLVNDAINL